jgi:hypothetical protein
LSFVPALLFETPRVREALQDRKRSAAAIRRHYANPRTRLAPGDVSAPRARALIERQTKRGATDAEVRQLLKQANSRLPPRAEQQIFAALGLSPRFTKAAANPTKVG